jgi:quercetin dioxygenase-like cupin family protein
VFTDGIRVTVIEPGVVATELGDHIERDGRSTGLQSVDLWGNSKTSAHGTLSKCAAGLSEPPHTHSRTFRALIIAGTMRYVVGGQISQPLGPGSYIVIAPGAPHFAQCSPESSCHVYVEQAGPLDVKLSR